MVDAFAVRKATAKDVDAIFALVNEPASQGLMLSRSKFEICTRLANIVVATGPAGEVIGCGSLIPLWTDLAEIIALSVRSDFRRRSVGRKLVQQLVDDCRQLKICTVMTLTYQVEFFTRQGFTLTDKSEFPRKLWRECLDCPKLEQCDETAMKLEIRELI
jgi:amino-acid N-acetyltransferase